MKRAYNHSVSNAGEDGNLTSIRAQSPMPSQTSLEGRTTSTEAATLSIGGPGNFEKASNHHKLVNDNQDAAAGTAKRPKVDAEFSVATSSGPDEQAQISHVLQKAKELVDTTENESNIGSDVDGHTVSNSTSDQPPEQGGVVVPLVVADQPPPTATPPIATSSRVVRRQRETPSPAETRLEDPKQATRKQSSGEKKSKKNPAKAEPKSANYNNNNRDNIAVTGDAEKASSKSTSRRPSGTLTSAAPPSNAPTSKKRRSSKAKTPRTSANSSPVEIEPADVLEADPQSNGDVDLVDAIAPLAEGEEVVAKYIELTPLPRKVPELPKLKPEEIRELELALEFDPASEETWREDWSGNLAYADKEISNPIAKGRSSGKTDFKQSLFLWATNGPRYLRLLQNLVRYVYHQKGTPPMAKKIIASANQSSVEEVENSIRRVSYDPTVLRQDGWTTAKSKEMIGATGGPFLIGDLIFWHNNEAVVIAYVHDDDHLGDLWKAMYLDDMETFDLEAEELQSARQKWERKQPKPAAPPPPATGTTPATAVAGTAADNNSRRSGRTFAVPLNFNVPGMEHGIVLAASYNPNARQGVFWPARIMHVTEMDVSRSQSKRVSSRKANVDVVFLAPYWNSRNVAANSRGRVESFADSMSRHGKAIFTSGPLFEIETIEVSEDQIKPYTFSLDGIDIEQLRVSFRFSGLPKAAFPRFLDSHRLAVALKTFAASELDANRPESDVASAALFDAHPFAVQTARFPPAILHLPFEYILSQLPQPTIEQPTFSEDDQSNIEAVINLSGVLKSMRPPMCWGKEEPVKSVATQAVDEANEPKEAPFRMPMLILAEASRVPVMRVRAFMYDLQSLTETVGLAAPGSPVSVMVEGIDALLARFWERSESYKILNRCQRQQLACAYSKNWALTKAIGEEVLSSGLTSLNANGRLLISEWRKASERIYRFVTHHLSAEGFGNKVTLVVTDSRCNLHLTSRGCVERQVRIPVALKAAKQVGAGSNENIQLVTSVDDRYLQFAENCVLPKAHSTSYLRRMKNRCALIAPNEVAPLTEDSDGQGGEDTNGSRGTWTAAVAAVATSIYAVDRIVAGECVNAFCASRPPGHHAGRELHPMKAVSNGFCVLNTAACAALYATTPVSEGGPGLRRVCIIDFDVHHGNGTQDILCSTYDPRFLYISLHAGGAHINGYEDKDSEDQDFETLGSKRQEGIYPGRCGDSSPHLGVVNVPLGTRVTPIGIGSAMVDVIRPAVDNFSPDLIILSAGFDAHKNDPLGLGGMAASDFGTLTDVICKLAHRICGGRVLSVLEGGYGIPCCGVQENTFLPPNLKEPSSSSSAKTQPKDAGDPAIDPQPAAQTAALQPVNRPPRAPGSEAPSKILELGEDLPPGMVDQVPPNLLRRLEKCHAEGFMDCVRSHVQSLVNCNTRVSE